MAVRAVVGAVAVLIALLASGAMPGAAAARHHRHARQLSRFEQERVPPGLASLDTAAAAAAASLSSSSSSWSSSLSSSSLSSSSSSSSSSSPPSASSAKQEIVPAGYLLGSRALAEPAVGGGSSEPSATVTIAGGTQDTTAMYVLPLMEGTPRVTREVYDDLEHFRSALQEIKERKKDRSKVGVTKYLREMQQRLCV
jgi:hypothetical protein